MSNMQLENKENEVPLIPVDHLPRNGTSMIPDYSGPPLVLDTTDWIQMSPEAYLDPEPRRPKPVEMTTESSTEAPVVVKKCCGRG